MASVRALTCVNEMSGGQDGDRLKITPTMMKCGLAIKLRWSIVTTALKVVHVYCRFAASSIAELTEAVAQQVKDNEKVHEAQVSCPEAVIDEDCMSGSQL